MKKLVMQNPNVQPKNQSAIATNLSSLLRHQHLSANQLAQILKISRITIGRILTGGTEDPRMSTLMSIANYFEISIDSLVGNESKSFIQNNLKVKSYSIPKVSWELLPELFELEYDEKFLLKSKEWQSISLRDDEKISVKAFALESRPSMYPRFPKGTIFVIDSEIAHADGDIVLVKINNEFTLKELIIDPPEWLLSPLTLNSKIINFNNEEHKIIGVSLLTILYNQKLSANL